MELLKYLTVLQKVILIFYKALGVKHAKWLLKVWILGYAQIYNIINLEIFFLIKFCLITVWVSTLIM